jgi:hypothetical protein
LPAVLAYNHFLRRPKVHVTDLENFARDFLRLAQKHDHKLRVRQWIMAVWRRSWLLRSKPVWALSFLTITGK